MAAQTRIIGQFPAIRYEYTGTEAEVLAVQGPEGSEGIATDTGRHWRYEDGTWGCSDAQALSTVPTSNRGALVNVAGVPMSRSGGAYIPMIQSGPFAAMSSVEGEISGANSAVGSAFTYTMQRKAKAKFIGFRLVFRHYGSAAADITIAKGAVASDSANNGTALTWAPGNFSTLAAGQVPAAIGTSPNHQPGIVTSDVIGISGGAGQYAQARAAMGACTVRTISNVNLPLLNADTGDDVLFIASAGDHVTTIDAQVPAIGTPSYCPFDIEFVYAPEVRAYTIMDVGDSRSRGEWSTSQHYGPAVVAAKLAKTAGGIVLGALNVGWSSQTRSASHSQLIKMLRQGIRPSFACVWFESPNDGSGQSIYDRSYAQGILAVQECLSQGVVPLICTPTPRNSTSAALVSWQLQVSRVRDFATRSGLPLVDYAQVLEDPAAPGQWIAAYKAAGDGSNLHASQEGYIAQGTALYNAIRKFV